MIEMPVTFIRIERTAFPRITRHLDSATLLVGCMKSMEETGTPGVLFHADGSRREITGVKVSIEAAKKETLSQGDLPLGGAAS